MEELGAECIYIPLADRVSEKTLKMDMRCLFWSPWTLSGDFKILAELDNNFNNSITLGAGHPMVVRM